MITLDALNCARELHLRLLHGPGVLGDKPKLARAIEGQLFVVEANSNLPIKWRALLSRLKTDAHQRSLAKGTADDDDAISDHYEELTAAVHLANSP